MRTSNTVADKSVAVLAERWTRKGGRFVLYAPQGPTTFEFDGSGERADQLRNAVRLAQDLLDANQCAAVAFQPENGQPGPALSKVFERGRITPGFRQTFDPPQAAAANSPTPT